MQKLGFVHDMMDVKVLILFVTARAQCPLTCQQIYELCFQDDRLSYFEVCTALPEMVQSGHLVQEGDTFQVTPRGKEVGELTESSIIFSVRQRAENAVARFNRRLRRSSKVKARLIEHPEGDEVAVVELFDDAGALMKLELSAPDHRQASHLCNALEKQAELIYNLIMTSILDSEDPEE